MKLSFWLMFMLVEYARASRYRFNSFSLAYSKSPQCLFSFSFHFTSARKNISWHFFGKHLVGDRDMDGCSTELNLAGLYKDWMGNQLSLRGHRFKLLGELVTNKMKIIREWLLKEVKLSKHSEYFHCYVNVWTCLMRSSLVIYFYF